MDTRTLSRALALHAVMVNPSLQDGYTRTEAAEAIAAEIQAFIAADPRDRDRAGRRPMGAQVDPSTGERFSYVVGRSEPLRFRSAGATPRAGEPSGEGR